MRKYLLVLTLFVTQLTFAQYCGTSGPSVCTPGGLTSFGISDYTTFPCVKDSTPYDEVIKVFFPDTVNQFGFTITVLSIHIDSIVNLPCGLCWQCDNASFSYAGGSQACVRISGTANDAEGAYQTKMYGTALTSFGAFPGSLENIGFQFFLNVVGKNDNCSPVNISQLNTACSPIAAPGDNCHIDVELSSSNPTVNCNFSSTTLTLVRPTGSGYHHAWLSFNLSTFPPTFVSDSVNYSLPVSYSPNGFVTLTVTDSTGCVYHVPFGVLPATGPLSAPDICYATHDTSLASSNALQLVFQKNDWFSNAAYYEVYRQDTMNEGAWLIGSSLASNNGYILDQNPVGYTYLTTDNWAMNHYTITTYSTCGESMTASTGYDASVLNVDTTWGSGYPYLSWLHSDPINYSAIYIYSRYPGGNWRLRFSSNDLTSSSWIDLHPDSSEMQYMLGYALTVQCDPSRSAATMAFSNFGTTNVDPALVDTTNITTHIDENENYKMALFPNPVNDILSVQLGGVGDDEELNFNIQNTMGQLVQSQKVNTKHLAKLDVADLTPGVYTISVFNEKHSIAMKRFIKK